MAASQAAFENTCFPIFEKMINTVPNGVTLSPPIGPPSWITMDANLDLTAAGVPTYQGTIGTFGHTPAPTNASYTYGTIGGGNTGPKLSQGGSKCRV